MQIYVRILKCSKNYQKKQSLYEYSLHALSVSIMHYQCALCIISVRVSYALSVCLYTLSVCIKMYIEMYIVFHIISFT